MSVFREQNPVMTVQLFNQIYTLYSLSLDYKSQFDYLCFTKLVEIRCCIFYNSHVQGIPANVENMLVSTIFDESQILEQEYSGKYNQIHKKSNSFSRGSKTYCSICRCL